MIARLDPFCLAGDPWREVERGHPRRRIRSRNRRRLSRKSEGFIVPLETEGQHNPQSREGTLLCSRNRRVEDQGIAMSLTTPDAIRTLQRRLYTKAKQEPAYRLPWTARTPERTRLEDGACLGVKNIGKQCAGKSHARFDEGG